MHSTLCACSVFYNCVALIAFTQEDSKTYSNAKYLENFFEEQLAKWLPNFGGKSSNGGGNSNGTSTSSSNSPNLLAAAAGSPSPIENGRKSCPSVASLGDTEDGCLPAKRTRRTVHE